MTIMMQWHFPLKLVWMAQFPDFEIIDLDKGRIDSFVAVSDSPDAARPCLAQIVRSDNNRNVGVKCEPADIRWAYSQWLGSVRTIVGDVALWQQTFESGESGDLFD